MTATMQVELYKLTPLDDDTSDAVVAARNRELQARAGFTSVHTVTNGQARLDGAAKFYPELTGTELKVWRRFLPTVRQPGEFAYNVPPEEVYEAIITAKSLEIFREIQVWTPEYNMPAKRFFHISHILCTHGLRAALHSARSSVRDFMARSADPLAVGVVRDHRNQPHYYAIARWAESLESFDTIKRMVRKITLQYTAIKVAIVTLFALLAAALYNVVVLYGYGVTISMVAIGSIISAWIFFAIAAPVYDAARRIIKKHW